MTVQHTISKRLGERQVAALVLVAQGYTNAQIARELLIGEGTVKTMLGVAMTKLGANNRTHAVHIAHRIGLDAMVTADANSPLWQRARAENVTTREETE